MRRKKTALLYSRGEGCVKPGTSRRRKGKRGRTKSQVPNDNDTASEHMKDLKYFGKIRMNA